MNNIYIVPFSGTRKTALLANLMMKIPAEKMKIVLLCSGVARVCAARDGPGICRPPLLPGGVPTVCAAPRLAKIFDDQGGVIFFDDLGGKIFCQLGG